MHDSKRLILQTNLEIETAQIDIPLIKVTLPYNKVMTMMGLFGSETAEKVLLYLARYGEGYANGMAETFAVPVSMIQRQLLKFEAQGVLVSQLKGKTRMFLWNPRYPLLDDVKALLIHALRLVPEKERQAYYMKRTRPRRTGKPL